MSWELIDPIAHLLTNLDISSSRSQRNRSSHAVGSFLHPFKWGNKMMILKQSLNKNNKIIYSFCLSLKCFKNMRKSNWIMKYPKDRGVHKPNSRIDFTIRIYGILGNNQIPGFNPPKGAPFVERTIWEAPIRLSTF